MESVFNGALLNFLIPFEDISRPMIKRLDHITIIVSDLSRTIQFYCDTLGLFEIKRPKFEFPGVWLASHQDATRAEIHATLEGELAGKAGWGDRGVKRVSRGHHFAFEVQDAAVAEAYLRDQGVRIAIPIKTRADGADQFFVMDPDDHVVELFSHPNPA